MSTYLVNQSWLLNLKQTGAVAGIWKGSSFYSALMSAKVKRLRRVEITKDVEVDYSSNQLPAHKLDISSPDQVITFLNRHDHYFMITLGEWVLYLSLYIYCR